MLIQNALRTFKRAKQYYLTTVFTLALTLSMVLSVFALVDLVFFAPLPYKDSDNLYLLEGTLKSHRVDSVPGASANARLIDYLRKNSDDLEDVGVYHYWTNYKLYDQPKRPEVQVVLASHNLFSVLGVEAHLGRLFNETEKLGTKQPSVILGYRIWQQRYGSDPDVVGKKVQLNQRRFTVIGVAPDDIVLPLFSNLNDGMWIPLDMDETFNERIMDRAFMGAYKAVTRLSPDADIETVNERISALSAQGAEIHTPDILKNRTVGARVTQLGSALQGDSGPIVLMLMAGVLLLLVIALINLSSMQLAKAVSKVKTVAISFAFGASNKQLLVESFKHNVIVIGLAVTMALLLSSMSFVVIQTLAENVISRLDTLHISFNTLLLSLLLAMLIALLYSSIELSVVKEKNLTNSLQSSGKGVGKQMATGTSHILIGLQVTFSFLVLVAATHVVLSTLSEALRDNGVNTQDKWSLTVSYANIKKPEERKNIHRGLLSQLGQLGAVEKVTDTSEPRLPQSLNVNQVFDENNRYLAQSRKIQMSTGYFEQLDLAVVGERFKVGESELENYPVIVNQRLADLIGDSADQVLGQKISNDGKKFHTIIGVAANTYVPGAIGSETFEIYMPGQYRGGRQHSFLLTAKDNSELEQQVRNLIAKVDGRLDVAIFDTLQGQFDEKRKRHLFASWVAMVLASVSLLMVCIGINGIVNYMVQVKRYDLGVKLAMGACNRRLLKDSLLELMQPVAMALILSFSFSFLVIGYSNTRPDIAFEPNWLLIAGIWLSFVVVSLLVSFLPIQKILVGDPIKALRNE